MLTLVSDYGPAFRNRFEEECAKLGVRVEHSSAYNPSSQSGIERSLGSLKHLFKEINVVLIFIFGVIFINDTIVFCFHNKFFNGQILSMKI